jgi:hypothetical protein
MHQYYVVALVHMLAYLTSAVEWLDPKQLPAFLKPGFGTINCIAQFFSRVKLQIFW